MSCNKCNSTRVASVCSKASDSHNITIGDNELNDYMPGDMGIGEGDYVEFSYCLDCGQIQGTFPLPPTKLEQE